MTFPLTKRTIIRGVKEHIADGLGAACDYVANHEIIYAPCGGTIYTFKETRGGNWIGIKRDNGEKIEMAHLDKYLVKQGWLFKTRVKEGQPIAISGNSGAQTSGPHLHLQIIKNGKRLDPEEYFHPTSIPVIVVNINIPQMKNFQNELLKYSAGMLTCTWDRINKSIQGPLDQFGAYKLADEMFDKKYLPYRYLFIHYTPVDVNDNMLTTFYYPERNMCISKLPGFDPRSLVFEASHQWQQFFDANRGINPYINVDDAQTAVSDEMISKKLRSILPYTGILLKK